MDDKGNCMIKENEDKLAEEFIDAHSFSFMMPDMGCYIEVEAARPSSLILEKWLSSGKKLMPFRTVDGQYAIPPGC